MTKNRTNDNLIISAKHMNKAVDGMLDYFNNHINGLMMNNIAYNKDKKLNHKLLKSLSKKTYDYFKILRENINAIIAACEGVPTKKILVALNGISKAINVLVSLYKQFVRVKPQIKPIGEPARNYDGGLNGFRINLNEIIADYSRIREIV